MFINLLVNTVTVTEDIKDINKAIGPAREKWEKIGLGLGLSQTTLQQIKTVNGGEPAKCLYATIYAWLRRKDKANAKGITWRTLIHTLKSAEVDETDLAERLMIEKGKGIDV